MRLRFFLSVAIISIALAGRAQTSTNDEMARAIMGVYNQEIKEDPTNYEALYRRAAQFYAEGSYIRALQDVDNALKYAPSDAVDIRVASYSLRANILMMQQKYAAALDDLNIACSLMHDDYILTYQKANVEFELGNYAAAKADYNRLRRLNNRSVESLVGLARVAVQENNLGLANDYIDQALELAPNDGDSYLRRASVRRLLKNNTGAAEDYMSALALGQTARAIQGIVELSDIDYPAVITTLSDAMQQAPEVGIYCYLRGVTALNHYHYNDALRDFNTIIDRGLINDAAVYDALARCQLALGQYQQALDNSTMATSSSPSTPEYHATRAKVLYAMGRSDESLRELQKAPEDSDSKLLKADICIAANDDITASTTLADIIFSTPELAQAYITRAWLLSNRLNDRQGARDLLTRVLDMSSADDNDPESLRGFALMNAGRRDEARKWAERIATNADPHGRADYVAACLYAQLGDNDAAIERVEAAMKKGYADYDAWTRDSRPVFSIAPLRSDSRFTDLLSKYASLF